MAAHTGKEQPPAYTSEDQQASATAESAAAIPYHSTRASKLFRDTSQQGLYTMSQYLERTLSVLVRSANTLTPVVLAMDEDYDGLLNDFVHMFPIEKRPTHGYTKGPWAGPKGCMRAAWKEFGERASTDLQSYSDLNKSNITVILRLLKSRNCVDYIQVY